MTDPQLWQESFREGYVDAMRGRMPTTASMAVEGYRDGHKCGFGAALQLGVVTALAVIRHPWAESAKSVDGGQS